jgi:hypothetical protein
MPRKSTKSTKKSKKLTPEQIALKGRPGWRALTPARRNPSAKPDEVSPELNELRQKFLGDDAKAVPMPADDASTKPTTIVTIAPEAPVDGPSPGAKQAVIQGETKLGETS